MSLLNYSLQPGVISEYYWSHVIKKGDHLLWRGPRNYITMQPIIGYKGEDGKSHTVSVRAWAFREYIDELPKGYVTKMVCEQEGCVNAAHMVSNTRSMERADYWMHRRMTRTSDRQRRKTERKQERDRIKSMRNMGISIPLGVTPENPMVTAAFEAAERYAREHPDETETGTEIASNSESNATENWPCQGETDEGSIQISSESDANHE